MESRGHDIKAAFDGKALANGVGNSGEEDVYGFELNHQIFRRGRIDCVLKSKS